MSLLLHPSYTLTFEPEIHFQIELNSSGQLSKALQKSINIFQPTLNVPLLVYRFACFLSLVLPLKNFQVSGALRFILNDKHVGCCVCRGRRIDTFTYLSPDLSYWLFALKIETICYWKWHSLNTQLHCVSLSFWTF
jgi:hypothetical protein